MDSIHLIRENLQRSRTIVLSNIDDMRNHCVVAPTRCGGCHTLWLLGHMAFIEALVINDFMQGLANPLADWEQIFDGNDVSKDLQTLVSFENALQTCQSTRASTIELINSMTEADLDQTSANAPDGTEELFGTYRRCFQYAADHWLMHRGQLANARLAAGLDKMWY